MRGPELAEMNAFVAVAERRSFAKAALQLGISRSRLSETIRGLEDRLGVRLLNRTTRSVASTAAGERLLARLRPLLDDFAAALDSINAFRDKPAGMLRLTVMPPAANFMLAPLLSRFLAQYPAIDLEISVDAALTDIVAGRFDAGIRAGSDRIERDMGVENGGITAITGDYGYEPNGVIHDMTNFPEDSILYFTNFGPIRYIDDDDNTVGFLDWQGVLKAAEEGRAKIAQ